MLVHLSRRLTGELIAYMYIRRHPASARLSVNIIKRLLCRSLFADFLNMTQIYNWVCGGSELHVVCFILIGEELRYIKKWKIASSPVSMEFFLWNTIDVSLSPYHYHVIL